MTPAAPNLVLAVGAILGALLVGVWTFSLLDGAAAALIAGRRPPVRPLEPLRRAAFLLAQQHGRTERPDEPARMLAPALYLALAAVGAAVVPWSAGAAPADVPAGIVLWGGVEALAIVAVFLHGWSANAPFALIGAYRYVALGLCFMLVSMFVLIAAALPAESLRLSAIVTSQRGLWNVVRQPLGLPLFLFVGLGLTFWGPLDFADSADLADGTASEVSGPSRLVWEFGRRAMIVAFSAVAATVFLGGWLGPWLPGAAWLALKTLAVMALVAGLGHLSVRLPTERVVALVWIGLLPLSFLGLAVVGLEVLR